MTWFGFVSFTFFVPYIKDGDEGLKARFCRVKQRECHKLICPFWKADWELQFDVLISATGDKLDSRIHVKHPKVFFSSAHGDHILTLRPQFFFEMMSWRVSMSVTCEEFVKGICLILLPLKMDSIWFQTLTPRVLIDVSQWATIWGWRRLFCFRLICLSL